MISKEREWAAAKQGVLEPPPGRFDDDDPLQEYVPQEPRTTIVPPKPVEQQTSSKDMRAAIKSAFTQIKERFERGNALAGVTTGYPQLDRSIDGLRRGTVCVVGARSGVGKSIFAVNVALAVANAGHAVEYFSLEMTTEEQVKRAMFCWSRVQSHRLKNGTLTKEDWAELTKAGQELSALSFGWDDSCGLTIEDIESRVERRVKSEKQKTAPLYMVVIDHMLLIRGSNQRQDRRLQLVHITSRIKEIAKKYNVVVLALTQLNRGLEQRQIKDKRPQISDLKESGSTEEDADVILLLYRADCYERERSKWTHVMECHVAKVREGDPRTVGLHFDGDRYCLSELAAEPGDEP